MLPIESPQLSQLSAVAVDFNNKKLFSAHKKCKITAAQVWGNHKTGALLGS
jgi:hypothetical protein